MKVLIINPPVREEAVANIIPWGLVYVAQSLLDEGHEVRILDVNACRWSQEQVLDKISELDFDLVMTGGIITVYSYLKWVTLAIRERYPDIPIIAGGFVATPIPQIIFANTGVDIICYGEGDITVKELLSKWESGGDLLSVNGLYIKKNGEILSTPPRALIKNLDDVPIPKSAYKLLPMDIYFRGSTINEKRRIQQSEWARNLSEGDIEAIRSFSLISGRGCSYNCSFCYRMIKGLRQHSVDYMIEHIEYLRENYEVRNFVISDESFTSNPRWIERFCDELISNNMNICFRAWARADSINLELLTKMKAAGCYWLGFGFESGSQKMLDVMNKKIDVRKNYEAVELVRKSNIQFTPTFIVGMPGEDRATIQETRELIKKCRIDDAGFFFAQPYPNAELYNLALEKGLIDHEERYIESLDDASRLAINLTSVKDNTLRKYCYLLASEVQANRIAKKYEGVGNLRKALGFLDTVFFVVKRSAYSVSYDLLYDLYQESAHMLERARSLFRKRLQERSKDQLHLES